MTTQVEQLRDELVAAGAAMPGRDFETVEAAMRAFSSLNIPGIRGTWVGKKYIRAAGAAMKELDAANRKYEAMKNPNGSLKPMTLSEMRTRASQVGDARMKLTDLYRRFRREVASHLELEKLRRSK